MRHRIALLALTLLLSLGILGAVDRTAQAAGGYQSKGAMMGSSSMGAAKMVGQDAFVGLYDAHHVTYLSTDSSNKAQAAAWHINYSAALAAVHGAPAIYLVQGRAAASQIAVFGSQPGDPDYSPLWQETNVSWKAGARAVLLTSDNQILDLAKKGQLTVRSTGIILNCPIIRIGK